MVEVIKDYSVELSGAIEIPATVNGYSVTGIGEAAFIACSGLTSVTIPEGVTNIGRSAFNYCSSLTSITIPASVKSIGEWAFEECTGLTSIMVNTGNESYSSKDGVLFNKAGTTLLLYPLGKTETVYTIPDGVTSIGDFAFFNCSSLTSVTIPEGVTSIGDGTFSGCI